MSVTAAMAATLPGATAKVTRQSPRPLTTLSRRESIPYAE